MHCLTEEDYIEYGKRLYREEVLKKEQGMVIYDGSDLAKMKWPVSVEADGESDYRRGSQHGFAYAVEILSRMRPKGYSRVVEITNILAKFEYEQLLPWRYSARKDVRSKKSGLGYYGHPFIKLESWWSIRKRIFERDGFQCVECGSGSKLQCDHIVPVFEGGIAEDENLQTLCKSCNIQKGVQ